MRKPLSILVIASVMGLSSVIQAYDDSKKSYSSRGGFVGPSEKVIGISELEAMKLTSDDVPVTLKGTIKSRVSGDQYRFVDTKGKELVIKIESRAWGQLQVSPEMTVLLHGEAERDSRGLEVEIDRVTKAQ